VTLVAGDRQQDARLRSAILAEREPAVRRLRELEAALRQHAGEHAGELPESLAGLEHVDPLSGEPIGYYGAGRKIDPVGSVRRSVLLLTPPHKHAGDPQQHPWQTVLFTNGVVRSGVFSRPGDLVTGPGPNRYLPLGVAFSFFFVWVFSGIGSPAGMVRVMASQDTPTIRRSIFLLSSYNLCIYVPLIVICICGRAVLPDLGSAHSDEIVPSMALLTTGHLPGGALLSGLILAAPFGAVMATVSSYLVVIASGLVRDVYQRFVNPEATVTGLRRLSYGVMIVVGAIGVAANLRPVEYLQAIVVFSGTCGATTFVVPAILLAYWRRATAAGTAAAMLTGVGATLFLYGRNWIAKGEFTPWRPYDLDPIIWGLAGSLVAGVTVSLLTRPPDAALVSRLFDQQPAEPAKV
jgi:Na+/proline symporter